ncbi:MAG: DUF2975 domain-containing protein [Bacillota bacterium]|nr:DUF2975 domain-containing protein [Bacillota bacterium]
MKEKALKRIRRMGKVGLFFTVIAQIVVTLGMVAMILGAVACAFLPANLISIDLQGETKVVVNVDSVKKLSKSSDAEDLEKLVEKWSKEGKLYVDGKEHVIGEVSKDGKKLNIQTSTKIPSVINMTTLRNILGVTALYFFIIFITLMGLNKLCRAIKNCESPFENEVVKRLRRFSYTLWPWVIANSAMTSIMALLMNDTSSISIRINMGMLAVVLATSGIVYVFKYGAYIQQEAARIQMSKDIILAED